VPHCLCCSAPTIPCGFTYRHTHLRFAFRTYMVGVNLSARPYSPPPPPAPLTTYGVRILVGRPGHSSPAAFVSRCSTYSEERISDYLALHWLPPPMHLTHALQHTHHPITRATCIPSTCLAHPPPPPCPTCLCPLPASRFPFALLPHPPHTPAPLYPTLTFAHAPFARLHHSSGICERSRFYKFQRTP